MNTFLVIVVVILIAALAYAGHKIETLYREMDRQATEQFVGRFVENHHATTEAIWNKVREQTLRDAAEKWAVIEEQGRRKELSWVPGNREKPPVVVWLNDLADRINPPFKTTVPKEPDE